MLATGLTVFGLALVAAPLGIAPAGAICDTVNGPDSIFGGPSTDIWGIEAAVSSPNTCDSDKIYRGRVYDWKTDGSCVSVQFSDGGGLFTQATSCNSSGVLYTFWDQSSPANTNSYMRLCRNQGCTVWFFNTRY